MARVRVAACQINTVVGDLEGNADRITASLGAADRAGADLNFERSHLGYAQYGVLALTRAPATP